ncbi:polysaccharide biosynthesis/export family protein [Chitinophagaceae bacterium LB-8]|uniref:Polysaccharide biosynthesis/export family protein n=1 Tax=Paraflavisolibacter caeni TaxID=2982496 RepID=A0A9X2XPM3_9BACT|nr:polysaccharide biosynthesis/export family protein [Paraflavisolibacter caeni]MCU7551279.1 polysaccharide biosynthesis/export family protein [Paraflavisolibacter caeni]
MRFFSILAVICSLVFASCKTQKAVYNYLEDMKDTAVGKQFYIAEPVIQKNDQLSIQVYSASLDPQVDQLYNMNPGGGGQQLGYGYLVDQKGNLELPRLGKIHAEGLTKTQLGDTIKGRLTGQLNDPSVIIRFTNFRIIVIGEVGSPGVKTIPVENLTILEALAMAGDIRESGKKKEVKILRENNGKRQLGIVDVTNSKLFESPYYQLQQNDVVMVEKTRYSVQRAEQGRIMTQIGFGLTIISTIALLVSLVNK